VKTEYVSGTGFPVTPATNSDLTEYYNITSFIYELDRILPVV